MSTFFARPQGNLLNCRLPLPLALASQLSINSISLTPNQMTAFKKSKYISKLESWQPDAYEAVPATAAWSSQDADGGSAQQPTEGELGSESDGSYA